MTIYWLCILFEPWNKNWGSYENRIWKSMAKIQLLLWHLNFSSWYLNMVNVNKNLHIIQCVFPIYKVIVIMVMEIEKKCFFLLLCVLWLYWPLNIIIILLSQGGVCWVYYLLQATPGYSLLQVCNLSISTVWWSSQWVVLHILLPVVSMNTLFILIGTWYRFLFWSFDIYCNTCL